MSIIRKLKHLKITFKYRKLIPYIDKAYYNTIYPDVSAKKIDPLLHYILNGWQEGRDPSPWFSTRGYLLANSDVAAAGVNPLDHYVRHGRREQRPLNTLGQGNLAGANLGAKSASIPFVPQNGIDHAAEILRYIYFLYNDSTPFESNEEILNIGREIISKRLLQYSDNPLLPNDDSALYLHASAIFSLFDQDYYLENNPDVANSGMDPIIHYCRFGWWELRNPNPDFDLWWYWRTYLNPKSEFIDPLLHYALLRKKNDLKTRGNREIALNSPGISYNPEKKIRRICLFAAFDPQGVVDDYVIIYLKELSRFADIYYLADCKLQPGEAEKLDGIVKRVWMQRHGAYDFGSYAKLAKHFVGWDVIETYDELIFANDSCYLINTLDHVFAKMDKITTDWWGLQATKGLHSNRQTERKKYPTAIPMRTVKDTYLNTFQYDYNYNFHIGSYFVIYRKNIINNLEFRKYINNIQRQENKLNIIKKYECGITQFLIENGYKFDTFIDYLYPIHPIYTETIFELIKDGFPLLKRLLLSENHYYVADLDQWKKRLLAVAPDANVDAIEANVYRVSNSEKLYRNLRVRRDEHFNPIYPQMLDHTQMAEQDASVPKYDHWWVFPACAYDHTFASNERAVFEAVRYNPKIKKIILTRDKPVNLDGENVEIYPLKSPEGQNALLHSKVIFIKHTANSNTVYPISGKLRYFINLWHGIPLKRIGYASLDTADNRKYLEREHRKFTATISSSKVDTMAMAAGFYPLSYNDIWMTGLPRNDFIIRPLDKLPEDLQREEYKLRTFLADRKLILFCPTFRNGDNGMGYKFSDHEVSDLNHYLEKHNAVLGIREHMADRYRTYSSQLFGKNFINLSSNIYPNIEILYRISSCLITDYSSCFVDYILTGKHAISFAYDLEDYQNRERGTFYDLDFAFPGDICPSFRDVLQALDKAADNDFKNCDPSFEWKKRLFFAFLDDHNSQRVVDNINHLLGWDS